MARNRNNDKKSKRRGVSKKNTVVAMLIALLAFIGIGNWGLGDTGKGEGDDSGGYEQDINDSESRDQEEVDNVSDEAQDITELDSEEMTDQMTQLIYEGENLLDETKNLTLYLKEDRIYLDETFETAIELDVLDELLDDMPEEGKVSVMDKGATKRFVTDVEEMIDKNDVPRNVTQ